MVLEEDSGFAFRDLTSNPRSVNTSCVTLDESLSLPPEHKKEGNLDELPWLQNTGILFSLGSLSKFIIISVYVRGLVAIVKLKGAFI